MEHAGILRSAGHLINQTAAATSPRTFNGIYLSLTWGPGRQSMRRASPLIRIDLCKRDQLDLGHAFLHAENPRCKCTHFSRGKVSLEPRETRERERERVCRRTREWSMEEAKSPFNPVQSKSPLLLRRPLFQRPAYSLRLVLYHSGGDCTPFLLTPYPRRIGNPG